VKLQIESDHPAIIRIGQGDTHSLGTIPSLNRHSAQSAAGSSGEASTGTREYAAIVWRYTDLHSLGGAFDGQG